MDSQFKDLKVYEKFTTRGPVMGNNTWNSAAYANCLSRPDIEGEGDGSVGLRPCLEYGPYGGIHNAIGG